MCEHQCLSFVSPKNFRWNITRRQFHLAKRCALKNSFFSSAVFEATADNPILTVSFDVGDKVFMTALPLLLQQLVLDYLPYGSITLPIAASGDMFLLDMDFYGAVTSEGTMKTCIHAWTVQVTKCNNAMKNTEEGQNIDILAHHCAGQYLLGISHVSI